MRSRIRPPKLRTTGRGWREKLLKPIEYDDTTWPFERLKWPFERLNERLPWQRWFAIYPVRVALIPKLTHTSYYPAWRWVWLEWVEYKPAQRWVGVEEDVLTKYWTLNHYRRYRFTTKEE